MSIINLIISAFFIFIPQAQAPKKEVLLPKTCYFINRSCMDEIDMVCQKGTREDFFFCINWTRDLNYDVCNDYDNLWMEEYHIGQTIEDEGFFE